MIRTPAHKQTDPIKYPGQIVNPVPALDTTARDTSKLEVWIALVALACALIGAVYGIVVG
jgi:hypothetical protein